MITQHKHMQGLFDEPPHETKIIQPFHGDDNKMSYKYIVSIT